MQAVIETRLFKVGPQPTNLQTKHNAFAVLSRFSPAASKAVRSPRPPYVFLRVGEVVIDRKGFMVGVVVSWDPEMRAPTEWVDRVYANSEVSGSITVQETCGKSRVPLYSVTLFHNDNKKNDNAFSVHICTLRRPKQKIRLITKCCSAGMDLPLWPLDTCLRLNCSASLDTEYV